MDLSKSSKKEIGAYGEVVATKYLKKHGFKVLDRNVTFKIGEIDIVAKKDLVLHIVEVKSIACDEFPDTRYGSSGLYSPEENLSYLKIQQVSRVGQWYVASKSWEGEWQVDGITALLRRHDGMARISYFPHIV